MENIIIGTAGHVDHGKTCLIKALSGIDTDRLKEEKKRGITIENGFANLPNDKGLHIGIIDVPGHEKFVKNMLAGIGGIDLVLLVISLEEGIKPQTIEHFEIVKSLGIKKGIVVYTKLDSENKVDFENLKFQVKGLLNGSALENAKEICVSSFTGKNIDLLKELIFENVVGISRNKSAKSLTRLPIDRVFTMEGFGTVITGTLMEGEISINDELIILPKNKIVKVRQIESHGEMEENASSGQRTAINLLNIKKEEIDRGDVLCAKDSMLLSDIIECNIVMFKSASRGLKNGEKVHFNYGSAQTEAIVNIISEKYVRFKFENPVPVKRGDKYIIRFISPAETCGGGIVLDIDSKKRKNDENYIRHLDELFTMDDNRVLNEIIKTSNYDFPSIKYIAKKMNKTIEDIDLLINTNSENNIIVRIGDLVLSKAFYDEIISNVKNILTDFHKTNPILKGIKKEELKSTLNKRYIKAEGVLNSIIDYLINNKILKRTEDRVSLQDFDVKLDDKESKTMLALEKKYLNAGYEPPDNQSVVDEMASGHSASYKLEVRQMLLDLAKNGILIKLSKDYYIHKTNFDKAIGIMMKYFETHDKIMMRDLRDLLNTSRKYAILIIDYCDLKHITKLIDDYRVLYK